MIFSQLFYFSNCPSFDQGGHLQSGSRILVACLYCFSKHFLTFWYNKVFQAHLVPNLTAHWN